MSNIIISEEHQSVNHKVDPLTVEVYHLLKSGELIESLTNDPHLGKRFSYKGFHVQLGKIFDGLQHQAFAFGKVRGREVELHTDVLETEHEAGHQIVQYINAARRMN